MALNWLIGQGGVIPIPGAKNGKQAQDNAGSLRLAVVLGGLDSLRTSQSALAVGSVIPKTTELIMKRILVTGATGRTGSLVVQKLRERPQEFDVVGFARSPQKAEQVFGSTEGFVFGDIGDRHSLDKAMNGCEGLVILTSAVPQVVAPPSEPGQRPTMGFAPGGEPEQVDYQGQVNQIEAAKAAGVQQVVLVGSMGGNR